MRAVQILFNPALLGVLSVFLSVLWMLKDQKDKTRPLLVIALVLNLFYGLLLTTFMAREGGLFPWKFDYILFHIDRSLGIEAAPVAAWLHGLWRVPLWIVYQAMVPMMIAWFLVTRYRGARGSVVLAYAAELVTGPLLYAIVPACGPLYAFGQNRLHPPAVPAHLIRLAGMPNAFPSLHVGTAFLFVLFAPGRLWKAVALAFFAATCLATLATGEHYVIDLVPGLAFGAFAACAGLRDFRRAIAFLLTALAWSLAVRYGFSLLIDNAWVTRSCAALTVALAALEAARQWNLPEVIAEEPCAAPA